MNRTRSSAVIATAVILSGCAPDVVRVPADLASATASSRRFETTQSISVTLASGYSRTVAAGTQLSDYGTIAQGRVLKPTNTVLSVEGAHVHEAYLVVDGARLVGFYLPFERAFASLPSPVNLELKESSP